MAFGLAVYVSRSWLPFLAQDSLPAAGQALPDGLPPAGFHQKVSRCILHPSSFSKLLGTIPISPSTRLDILYNTHQETHHLI